LPPGRPDHGSPTEEHYLMALNILASDIDILRKLATRIRDIAHSDENLSRKQRWLRHNALQAGEPMILAEVGGLQANGELPTVALMQCQEKWARDLELGFRNTLYSFEAVKDDWVVEPSINCNWLVNGGWYGVHSEKHSGSHDGVMGSYVWEPPLKNLQDDLKKLKPRQFSVDREGTLAWKAHLEKHLGDILPVRIRGGFWWTMGMTATAIDLVGLEQLMFLMVDDPDGLHSLMQFLRDDANSFIDWLEKEKLFSLNNENDYIGSGSLGYSNQLPQKGMNGHPRAADLWCLSESQETVGVGPEMFGEFIFPYQKSVIERFGLSYYGCCEPVHNRWHIVQGLSNLRKVSVSPWCDEAFMARALADKYVYCRKPNPALVSTDHFDEKTIREDLRKTINETRKQGCILEIVMKDVHTVHRQPERLARWVELAQEAARA
jgi:hypothetical protein